MRTYRYIICSLCVIYTFQLKSQHNIPKSNIFKKDIPSNLQIIPTIFSNTKDIFFNHNESSQPAKISDSAFKTNNKAFVEQVLVPTILPNLYILKKKSHSEIINEFAILIFKCYQKYFGESFYRWGGDLFDIDDAQTNGINFKALYGLDCSGFTTSSYELAVFMKLIPDSIALFSHQGFKKHCLINNKLDKGGVSGGSNNFRVDSGELDDLGQLIFKIEKGKKPSRKQLNSLQAGDIAGRNGHYGIIIFIKNEPYYLESGGWVVPVVGGYPVKAKSALSEFAKNGYVNVRRCIINEK